jgi:hypothetical protein
MQTGLNIQLKISIISFLIIFIFYSCSQRSGMLEEKLYNLLYAIIKQNVDGIKGKICVPISGGLDSRVVAGYMQILNRPIDLVIVLGNQHDKHVSYAEQIAHTVGYSNKIITASATKQEIESNKSVVQSINGLGEMSTLAFTCLQKINQQIGLSEYTFLVPYALDWFTGIKINALTVLRGAKYFYKKDYHFVNSYYPKICVNGFKIFQFFGKDVINPIWWSQSLFEFCTMLPLKERFHQRLYRRMIKTYFPKLAVIPRSGMNCRMDCNEITYFIYRTLYFLKKIWNKNKVRY